MAVFLPQRWRQQPQGSVILDSGNPLANGAVVSLLPGTPYNIVTGEPVSITGSVSVKPTNTTTSGYPVGISRVWTNTATGASLRIASKQPAFNSITFGGLVAGNGTDSGMMSCMSDFTTQGYRFITGNSATPGKFRARISSTSGWTETGDLSQSTGSLQHITATWTSGGSMTVYFDAVSVGSSGTLGGTVNPSAALSLFGGAAANHQWALFYVIRRALSAGEVASLYRYPWQLFTTKKPVIYSFSSVAAFPTLSNARVTNVTETNATPVVTYTF